MMKKLLHSFYLFWMLTLALLVLCFLPLASAFADGAMIALAAQDKSDPNDLDRYYAVPSGKQGEALTIYIPLACTGGDAAEVTCTLKSLPAQFSSPAALTRATPVGGAEPVSVSDGAKAYFSIQMQLTADAAAGDGSLAFQVEYLTNGAPASPVSVSIPYRVTVPNTPAPSTPAPSTPVPGTPAPNTPTPTPSTIDDSGAEIIYDGGSSSGGGGGSSFKSKPKVIVSGYTFDAEKLYAGESFKMNLKLRNTSSREAVKNLQINFSNEAGIVMPVSGGSNTIFVGELARETGVSIGIGLQILPDAEPKAQMLNLEITYEGTKNKQEFTEKTAIAIPVVQKTRVRTDTPAFYDEAFAGQSCSMSVQMFNMGKSSLYNCMVSVTGEGLSLEETYYAGNIASGGTMRADLTLVTATAGDIAGAVHITYEDVYGDQSEEVLPFTLTVSENMPADPMLSGEGDMPFATNGNAALAAFNGLPAQGIGLAWYWWVILATLVATLVTIAVLKRRHRAHVFEASLLASDTDGNAYDPYDDSPGAQSGEVPNGCDALDGLPEHAPQKRRRRARKER